MLLDVSTAKFDLKRQKTHTLYKSQFDCFVVSNVIHNSEPARLTIDQCKTTNNNETMANMSTKEQTRKAHMKEYTTRRRRNNEFRNRQNRALQAKRLENIEKTRESQRREFNKRKESNLYHIRELNRQAFAKSKKSNPQHV